MSTFNFDEMSLSGSAAPVDPFMGGAELMDVTSGESVNGDEPAITFGQGTVVRINSYVGLCCAKVGNQGTKMCVRASDGSSESCPASHGTKPKATDLSPGFFKLESKARLQVLLEPYVPVEDVPEEDREALLGEHHSETSWRNTLNTIRAAVKESVSVKDFRKGVAFSKSNFDTPFKGTNAKALFAADTPPAQLQLETLYDSVEQDQTSLKGVLSTDVYLRDYLGHVRKLSLNTATRLKESNRKTGSLIKAVADAVGGLRFEFSNLEDIVGPKRNVPLLAGKRVWESFRVVLDLMEDTGVIELAKNKMGLGSKDYAEFLLGQSPKLGSMLHSYKSAIEDLQRKVLPGTTSISGNQGAPAATQVTTAGGSGSGHLALEKRLVGLEARLAGTNVKGNDMQVQFYGHYFSKKEDLSIFIRQENGGDSVPLALCTDGHTLFHHILRALQGDSQTAKEMLSVNQMGGEADVQTAIAANHNGTPIIFVGTGKALFTGYGTTKKHRFPGCPSIEVFGEAGSTDGLKYRILLELEPLLDAIRTDIRERVKSPILQGLLERMADRSGIFVRKILEFMVDTYSELVPNFEDKDATWDFVCHCVDHIFTHEFKVARSILRGSDVLAKGFGDNLLWSNLRTVVVQEGLLAKGIKNHQSLTHAYSDFILKNLKTGDYIKLKRKFDNMEATMKDLEGKVKAYDARIRSAESIGDRSVKRIKELETKINKK